MNPVIHSFESFEDAVKARDELLAQGLPAQAVRLSVIDDEAGPVEGSFVAGNGRRDETTPPSAVITGGAIPYDRNFARTVSRGVHLLAVEATDDGQRRLAEAVLARHGARDVAALAGRGART